jgi:hypothetical protein
MEEMGWRVRSRPVQPTPMQAMRAWHESTRSNSRMTVTLRGMVPTSSMSTCSLARVTSDRSMTDRK